MKKLLASFKKAQDGLAYLEFAISLPFLIALFMGSVELGRYILIVQKVEKTTVTISDVISQGKTISSSDLGNIIFASSQVMQPYVMGINGFVIVSSVKQTGNYSASNLPKVSWQYTSNGINGSWTQPSKVGKVGYSAVLPGNLTLNDKDNVIVTEVFYNFTPMIATNGAIGATGIYKTALFKPRLGDLSTLSMIFPSPLDSRSQSGDALAVRTWAGAAPLPDFPIRKRGSYDML